MLHWLAAHINGWEVFLPAILATSLAAAVLLRSARAELFPWAVLLPWAATAVTLYLITDYDRYWYYAKARRIALTLTLLVVTLPPFVASAIASRHRTIRALPWWRATVLTTGIGVGLIPLMNVLALYMAWYIQPLIVHD